MFRTVPCLIAACFSAATAAAAPRFWGGLTPGDYEVGFRRLGPERSELHVWYPAQTSDKRHLLLSDYLRMSRDLRDGVDMEHGRGPAEALATAITGASDGLSADVADSLLATATAAADSPPAAAGRFPLVLWTHRYGTTVAQHVLSEFLASHGFVVVYAPDRKPPRLPYELADDRSRAAELQSQVARLRSALRAARALPFVEPSRVGILAWSYAGESAHALQREAGVRVVIGLSTNLVSDWVYRPGAAASGNFVVPHVLIDAASKRPPAPLLGAGRETYFVAIPAMSHGSFNTLEGMIPSVAGIARVQPWSAAGAQQRRGYEVTAQYVERTLAHYLIAQRTLDTPYRMWAADGEPAVDAVVTPGVTPPAAPRQPGSYTTVRFDSADGHPVTADWYPARRPGAATIVLAHQSLSSRGEYRQIAPRLVALGFNALAVDTRWGDRDVWNGTTNETALAAGTRAVRERNVRAELRGVQDASAEDLRGALRWLRQRDPATHILLWGSSISANIVLKLAAEPQSAIRAVLAFSPGEYHPDIPEEMRTAVRALQLPTLIAHGRDEAPVSHPVFDAVASPQKIEVRAAAGRHGSSILLDDPRAWTAVTAFLRQFAHTARGGSARNGP